MLTIEIYRFFNSAPGDPRTYQASDFASYFGSVLSTGLLHTNEVPGMEVSVETGTLKTRVTPGKAIMRGYAYENTADIMLDHAIPEVTLDRIDRIVLRLNLANSERNIKLAVKPGVSAATPQAPGLQRDDVIYEISLAQVLVRRNTAQLLPADLKDERLDENLCGIVHSLISIPTSQFQKQWDDFLQGVIDEGFATTQYVESRVSVGNYGVTTGSGSGYVLNTSNGKPTELSPGTTVRAKFDRTNSGTPTIDVNGSGAKSIRRSNGSVVGPSYLKPTIYTLTYDGTAFILQGEGGGGNAAVSEILMGRTASTDQGEVVGTMPNRGNVGEIGLYASNQSYRIPAGFHDGNGMVTALYANPPQVATGTGSGSSSGELAITGLSFRPRLVYAWARGSAPPNHFTTLNLINGYTTYTATQGAGTSGGGMSDRYTITADGFRLAVPFGNVPIEWRAES